MQNLPIYSVNELNHKVRLTLEGAISTIGVTGEISNLVKASSGHYYFTLKDAKAQIRCAFFNTHASKILVSNLTNGLQILAYGKISLYEPRGDYQLIVQHIQESGVGLLYQQFIELKNKLEQKGLFSATLKKAIPVYPKQIAIITSPIGAAIHDILTTIKRRFPLVKTHLYPTEVQGVGAEKQIINALEKAQEDNKNDLIILARGGGSLEDLWAFNDEALAYKIRESQIPIITGIGHETDFTIADFVADYRAATPTAAAEKATPNQLELQQKIHQWQKRLIQLIQHKISYYQQTIFWFSKHFSAPEKLFSSVSQRIDYDTKQLHDAVNHELAKKFQLVHGLSKQIQSLNPKIKLNYNKDKLNSLQKRLHQGFEYYLNHQLKKVAYLSEHLLAIGPNATLARGYAIATYKNKILLNVNQVHENTPFEIQLFQGKLKATVKEIINE